MTDISELVEHYRDLKDQADSLKREMNAIKVELVQEVEIKGGKWTDKIGYARLAIRKSSVSYDAKALDILRDTMPEFEKFLTPHRKVRPGSTYLQIK